MNKLVPHIYESIFWILANKINIGLVDNEYEFEEHDREDYVPKDDGTFGRIFLFIKMRKFGYTWYSFWIENDVTIAIQIPKFCLE